jgi:TM2 domain-containing membrane protein YozV
MKDKNAAGILALFLGWLGFHRFYLGQTGLGIVYFMFCWFPVVWLIAIIDAISLFAMDQRRFDEKYNNAAPLFGGRPTDFERHRHQPNTIDRHDLKRQERDARKMEKPHPSNPFKKRGLEKFKDFDYAGAIEDFQKSVKIDPEDIATHFNLACVYSLTENAGLAFFHLDKAVEYGFKDFQKIKEHHALAYLRIHEDFDSFEDNGFRRPKSVAKPAAGRDLSKSATGAEGDEDLLNTEPDLLDQLNKLGELREKGLLTEKEFAEQKRKLLG